MTRLEPLDGAPLTLGAAAVRVDGRREGPAELALTGIAPVDEAGESDLAFLAARRYARYAEASPAAAFLVSEELESTVAGRPRIVVKDPHRALVLLLEAVAPRPLATPGVHPTAVLGTGVRLGDGVTVGPYAVLGEGVRVGAGCRIGAHAVVGDGAHLGEDVVLHPHVVIYPDTRVGSRSILHAGAVMGADGFGYVFEDGAHRRIPHLGRAVIEDDVEIGANTCVDRGSIGDTVVGAGTKMDNLVHIAHNVRVGARSLLAAMVGIAGSTRVGQGVMFGGQSGVVNHREIGDGARLAAAAKVMRDVAPGETVSGHPARPHREDLHRQAHLGRLPALADRVRALEAAMRALQGKMD